MMHLKKVMMSQFMNLKEGMYLMMNLKKVMMGQLMHLKKAMMSQLMNLKKAIMRPNKRISTPHKKRENQLLQ